MQSHSTPSYQQPADKVLLSLESDALRGLSVDEAKARLERDGRNELTADAPFASAVLWLREASKIVTRPVTKQNLTPQKQRASKGLPSPVPVG